MKSKIVGIDTSKPTGPEKPNSVRGLRLCQCLFLFGEIMTKAEYAEKLRSERWYETRNRINSYGKGRCEYCGCRTSFPEVHHEEYCGNHPSDTPDDLLKSLCRECHFEEHWIRRIRAYSAEKRRLYRLGNNIDEKLHQQLIKRFKV